LASDTKEVEIITPPVQQTVSEAAATVQHVTTVQQTQTATPSPKETVQDPPAHVDVHTASLQKSSGQSTVENRSTGLSSQNGGLASAAPAEQHQESEASMSDTSFHFVGTKCV